MVSSKTTKEESLHENTAFILASASPARRKTLQAAGIEPEVLVSNIDEDAITDQIRHESLGAIVPTTEVMALAKAKGSAVQRLLESPNRHGCASIRDSQRALLVSCDSMLEFQGKLEGKPHTPELAIERITAMQGNDATLWTGHHVALLNRNDNGSWDAVGHRTAAESTTVHFSSMSSAEIEAYVATGEPLEVAGSFTIDGLGGAFLNGVTGDPHSVVGLSLPLVRRLSTELGVFWPSLWNHLT